MAGRRTPSKKQPVSHEGSLSNGARPASQNNKMEGGEEEKKKGTTFLFLACFFGIFFSYLVYALLQEKITKRDFGDERFHYFMFLVCAQCIVNYIVAKFLSWYKGEETTLQPYGLYGLLSLSYVGSMVCSTGSLAYISYPTQVLGKSVKPIPVLILGVLLARKRYPLLKYIIVLLIVVGVAIFLYKDKPQPSSSNTNDFKLFDTIGIGELLLFTSLTLDGVTGALQDTMRDRYQVKALQLMFAVNFYAPLYLMLGLVSTGEGLEAVGFISRHPEVIYNILVFGLSSAVGQIFIFTTITNFGPLTCSIITTTRKFFTLLASVVVFGNVLLTRQWVGVVLVFLGLGLDVYFGKSIKTTPSKPVQSA